MGFVSVKTGEKVKLDTGYISNPVDYQTWKTQQTAKRPAAQAASAPAASPAAPAPAQARPSVYALENQARQAQADLDTDALMRINRQLKEERAKQDRYSVKQGVSDVIKKGANQFAQAGADTLAFAEDIVNAPFELFSGMELGSLRKSGEGIFNPIREKVKDEGTALAEKSAENVRKGGKAAELFDKYGTATVAAVPQSVIAMLTGGTSALAGTASGLTRTAAAELSPGVARTIQNAVTDLSKNPQFWSSFSQVVGGGYQQALEDGASVLKAALYAVGNGLMNAAVEVGGGIQTLPAELQAGASGWRALVDSALDEGKEEVVQGVIERAMQNLVYQKGNKPVSVKDPNAVFNPFTAAEEFAGGAIVGGILSGGQIAANKALSMGSGSQIAQEAPLAAREGSDSTPAPKAVPEPQKTAPRDVLMEAAARGGKLGADVDMQQELERFQLNDDASDWYNDAETRDRVARDFPALNRFSFGEQTADPVKPGPDITGPENMNRYRSDVDSVFSGSYPTGKVIEIGATPDILQQHGAEPRKITLTQDAMYKIAYPQGYMGGKHNLGMSVLKQIPYQLADPVAILRSASQPNSLVILTAWKNGDTDIIIPLHLNKQGALELENRVASVYGKGHIDSILGENNSNVLYTKNGEDIHQLLSKGVQFPQATADDILARNTIPQSAPEVKRADGLGAVDAGGVNTAFDNMQAKTDAFHPVNRAAEARTAAERLRAPSEVPVENPITGKNIKKTVSTILNSPLTSNEMAPILENAVAKGRFDYTAVTDRAAMEYAQSVIKKEGYQDAARRFTGMVDLGQRITKDDFAVAAAAYTEAEAAGDVGTMFSLVEAMGEAAHDGAQVIQAVNLMNRLTPAGKLLSLRRWIDRKNSAGPKNTQRRSETAGIDLEAARSDFVEQRTGFTISDELAADYLLAETDEARAQAWEAIIQDLADQIPNTLLEKWDAWRYVSMLTNPTTHIRNMAGNVAFGQIQRRVKNLLGAGLERAFIRDRGQRTKSILTAKDRALREFAAKQYETDQAAAMGQGKYSETGAGSIEREIREHRRILDGPFQWISEKNSAALDAEDLLFNRPAYVDSLAQALKAKGVTAEEAAYGDKAELVEAARDYAIREAQKATFRDANAFSDFVSKLGRTGDKTNPFAKAFSGAVDVLLPFRRTPANVLARGMEYSPAGLLKSVTYDTNQVRKGNMTAEEMLDHLSSGLTGSGILALGAFLASQGMLKLRGGDDEQERNFLKDMGAQDFALQLGDHSYTLGWLSPAAMPLFAGAALMEAWEKEGVGGLESFLSAMSGVTDVVLETSMLSSLDELLDGIGYADSKPWYLLSQTVMDLLSQGVPTVLSKTASALDDTVRSSYVPSGKTEPAEDISFFLQGLARKVPGARNTMQPKIDLWGRDVSNGGTAERLFESFASPGYYSRISSDSLSEELQRLAKTSGDSGVYPQKVQKYFKLNNGDTKYMTAEEYTAYARKVGQTRFELLQQIMDSPGYQSLSDDQKADAISDAYQYADAMGKMQVSDYRPGKGTIAAGALKSMLPPASYILYRINADRDGSGSVTAEESALTLMELDGLSNQQRGKAWSVMNDRTGNAKDQEASKARLEAKNPFTGVLSEEGFDPEESMEAWEIYNRKGTKEKPLREPQKKRAMREEMDLPAAEVNRLWKLMEKAAGEE